MMSNDSSARLTMLLDFLFPDLRRWTQLGGFTSCAAANVEAVWAGLRLQC